MRINSILTKNGETVELGQLTVLIGPNNSGKTTTLTEINQIMESGYQSERVLIDTLQFKEMNLEELKQGLDIKINQQDTSRYMTRGLTSNLGGEHVPSFDHEALKSNLQVINKNGWQNIANMGIGRLKITLLDSTRRLVLAKKAQTGRDDVNPLNELYNKKNVESNLQDAFRKAFGNEIKLDFSDRQFLRFRIAKKFGNIPPDPRDAKSIMEKFPELDNQGEGFRSFVGIILGIILSEGRIVLIDEPEAFLHPTQARVLGEWIRDYSENSDTQVIIATHSTDILDGLLQKLEDIVILRISRTDDNTHYHRISSELTEKLTKTPLISSQPVVESIFYKGTIITEGDKDRVIYKAVYSQKFDKREHLFVNTIGKHSIKNIILALKEAHVPVCAILDLDILNEATTFRELVKAFQSNRTLQSDLDTRDSIAEAVEGMKQAKFLDEVKKDIQKFSSSLESVEYSLDGARKELKKIYQKSGKWDKIKEKGVDGMPRNVQKQAKKLIKDLKTIGLFIVPVGELESWMKINNVPWVEGAYDFIIKGKSPGELTSFITEIIKYLDKN